MVTIDKLQTCHGMYRQSCHPFCEVFIVGCSPDTQSATTLHLPLFKVSGAVQSAFLLGIFMHAKGVGQEAVRAGAACDASLALEALRLCSRILEWDFRHHYLPSSVAVHRIWEAAEVRARLGPVP